MIEDASISDSTATDQQQHGQSSRRPLWICGGIVLVLVAAAAYVNLAHSRALCISRETTYITEPLKSDGKQVDYFAALQKATYPPDIATENNGFRLLVQHLGPSPNTSPEHFASLCDQLGLDAKSIRPDTTYQDPYEYLGSFCETNTLDQAFLDSLPSDEDSKDDIIRLLERLGWPWTLDELPMMAQWLEDNSPALDLMSQAVRKPTFYIPLARSTDEERLYVSDLACSERFQMTLFAHGLEARAHHRVAMGDVDGAIDDIITCKRLGRYVTHGAIADDLMYLASILGAADGIGIAGALSHPPDRRQLQRLLDAENDLPSAPNVTDMVLHERFLCLDLIQSLAHGETSWEEWGFTDEPPWSYLTSLGVDWNIVANRCNEFFDEFPASTSSLPYSCTSTKCCVVFMSLRARSEHLADFQLTERLYLCPPMDKLIQCDVCRQRMRRITLAMLLYERDHGTLPPAWSVDREGNPLHGWRVLLLPYLGHETLYKKIRLDEPWNSAHNRQFHGEEMAVYRCPSNLMAGPGQTTYSVVVGPDMPFEAGHGKRLADFGPNSDDMILLVERMGSVDWMDPTQEITQSEADRGIRGKTIALSSAPELIGGFHIGTVNVGLRNGEVRDVCAYESFNGSAKERLTWFQGLLRGTNTENPVAW